MPVEMILGLIVGIFVFNLIYTALENKTPIFSLILGFICSLLGCWVLIWILTDSPIIKTEEAKVEYRTMYNPDGTTFQQQIAQFSDKVYNLTEEKKQVFPTNTIVIREVRKPICYGIRYPCETYKIKYEK